MTFQPFNSRGELLKSRRRLPHWRQPGATYFVTFRLVDSLPHGVRERFEELRRLNDDEAFAWMDRCLDLGVGPCPLGNPENARIVKHSLEHFDRRRYTLGAFVVMPNHVHVLVQPEANTELSAIVHGWKSFTAHELQRHAGLSGSVWQAESFDRIVRNEDELKRYDAYIRANPSTARLPADAAVVGAGSARWFE